jgi:hypothetical protein
LLRPSDSLRLVQIDTQSLHDEIPELRVGREVRRARAADLHGRRVRRTEYRQARQLLRNVERARPRDRELARHHAKLQRLRRRQPVLPCSVRNMSARTLLGVGGALSPLSTYASPIATPSGACTTSSSNGPRRVSATVHAGAACSGIAAPSRTCTLMCPGGAASVTFAPGASHNFVRVPIAPNRAPANGKDVRDGARVRQEHRRHEHVAPDEELRVDGEELRLVGELEEERAYGRRAASRRIREERLLASREQGRSRLAWTDLPSRAGGRSGSHSRCVTRWRRCSSGRAFAI